MSVKGAVQDVKYLTDLEEERGFRAATSLIGDSHIVIVNPGISDDQINRTMAHESVHLMQHFRGDIRREGPGLVNWKGESYTLVSPERPEYEEQPWEQEAYSVGARLLEALEVGKLSRSRGARTVDQGNPEGGVAVLFSLAAEDASEATLAATLRAPRIAVSRCSSCCSSMSCGLSFLSHRSGALRLALCAVGAHEET